MQRIGLAPEGERGGISEDLPGELGVVLDVWALAHSIDARSKWMHRTLGITAPQRLVARVIGLSPGCSPGQAARRLRLHPASVTRLVAGLEASGLVLRERDRVDQRKLRLSLTASGRKAIAVARGTIEHATRNAIARTRKRDLAAARAFVQILTAELLPEGELS